ncbi:MAG: hypothetical protein HN712_17650 [Gemmatimonadetes bacterium]|jgi:uncharacterized HAD superfamily protein|nr:hypothetical protein [Gemmatimonadota bacterium]MBT6148686.1 hypothetical protein [Gemmatimonadota bacterium]MBT7862146.1 hypothetical protein [Gemmatimonadota bacterium]
MMAAPKRVYVDLDDVICDTGTDLLALLEQHFGRRVDIEDVTTWDLGISLGLDQQELRHFMELAHEPQVLQSHRARPGALERLAAWNGVGVEVWIVTGRPTQTYTATRTWLRDRQVAHTRLVFADKYGNYGGLQEMTDGVEAMPMSQIAGLGFDLAVEDSAAVAGILHDELEIPVALMDQPWNRKMQESDRLRRCHTWEEVDRMCGGFLSGDPLSVNSLPDDPQPDDPQPDHPPHGDTP